MIQNLKGIDCYY